MNYRSHGTGSLDSLTSLRAHGDDIVIEDGVLFFHPERISLGSNLYLGHRAILKSYYKGSIEIGDGTWIGQDVFMHGAGGITIGPRVGIGPRVCILTSQHDISRKHPRVMDGPLNFAPVTLEEGCDIGAGSQILPGVTIGSGAVVGAGSVVTRDVPPMEVWAGNPAKHLRTR